MKHLITLLLFLTSSFCKGQDFLLFGSAEIISSGTAIADLSIDFLDYEGKINGGFRWAAGCEYILKSKIGLGITNYNQKTTADVQLNRYPSGKTTLNETVNWLMITANKYIFIQPDKVAWYGGVGAGITSFSTAGFLNGARDDSFAWQIQTGVMLKPTKIIGFKIYTQYQMATSGTGLAFTSLVSNARIEKRTPFSQISGGLSVILNMNNLSETK
jgi:hypothetical protein